MLRAHHPSNNKRGSICIFYKTLPLRVLNTSYLSECINYEISIGNKVGRFIHLYKSNLKLNLDASLCNNPSLTVMIGDFNAKYKDWRSTDTTSSEDS